MALLELWKTSPKELQDKHVQQVISFSGDGKLKDGSAASDEFRQLLAFVPSAILVRYANQCLDDKFENSGLALQDVINEVGKRLGFQVEQGRYRGVQGVAGFDGLWRTPVENSIVVEVKTTDAYRMDLNTLARYRGTLIKEKRVSEVACSILIVVGRTDTGDLEAQVRGSRHAWDIRLISIDALLRLMKLKEELEDPKIMEKIRNVLTPQEFTKVDGIIDLVFSTAEDVKKEEPAIEGAPDEEEDEKSAGPKFTPVNFRDGCAERVQQHLGQPLVKRSFAVYSSPDEKVLLLCINSREYAHPKRTGFWFAFHPRQRELLKSHPSAFVALGCGSTKAVLLFPAKDFDLWVDQFHITKLEDRLYWHIRINRVGSQYFLLRKKGFEAVNVGKYLLKG